MKLPVKRLAAGRPGRSRINRAPSPVLVLATPWLTVGLASLAPSLPVLAPLPLLPPLGFMLFLAWTQVRPGLLPVWAGLPLGAFDDLYSGQPFGSAILLWSLAMIAIDLIEARFPWRSFITEWLIAAALIATYLAAGLVLANLAGGQTPLWTILPQLLLTILLYPAAGRLVAFFDRLRLTPFKVVR
ncbi:MAG TPA: rod shape-determining protein MreD [Novosphingobium sp.]|nr:rod shape-determining protein MreD [Novosphingobium sp.]